LDYFRKKKDFTFLIPRAAAETRRAARVLFFLKNPKSGSGGGIR